MSAPEPAGGSEVPRLQFFREAPSCCRCLCRFAPWEEPDCAPERRQGLFSWVGRNAFSTLGNIVTSVLRVVLLQALLTMEVKVKLLSGDTLSVVIPPESSVLDLKQRLKVGQPGGWVLLWLRLMVPDLSCAWSHVTGANRRSRGSTTPCRFNDSATRLTRRRWAPKDTRTDWTALVPSLP